MARSRPGSVAVATSGEAAGDERPASPRLAAILDEVASLDAAGLARRSRQLFGVAPPSDLSPALCQRIIAHRLQIIALSDLDRGTAQALARLGRAGLPTGSGRGRGRAVREDPPVVGGGSDGTCRGTAEGEDAPVVQLPPVPDRRGQQPGAVLSREWGGAMHSVMVLREGFAWNGSTYDSLSEVAQAITGTKWNGPRFFGLRDKASAGSRDVRRRRA